MTEVEILALTVYGEARGETYLGQLAVAHTILNRVKNPAWWGSTIAGVCLKPKQFSCWDDPNRVHIMRASLDDQALRSCLRAAISAMDNIEKDLTGGADHYHVTNMPVMPGWRDTSKITVEVGRHTFYKLRAGGVDV